jgi:hypothetical protein
MKLPRRRLFLAILATLVGTAGLGWFVATREDADVRRFRQIQVGMEIEDVKRLYPEKVPKRTVNIEPEKEPEPVWAWRLENGVLFVFVDQGGRVTAASYDYVRPFDWWLYQLAECVGIDYKVTHHSLELP